MGERRCSSAKQAARFFYSDRDMTGGWSSNTSRSRCVEYEFPLRAHGHHDAWGLLRRRIGGRAQAIWRSVREIRPALIALRVFSRSDSISQRWPVMSTYSGEGAFSAARTLLWKDAIRFSISIRNRIDLSLKRDDKVMMV